MKRKHNLRQIVSKRCYSTEEIAELLEVHIQTIRAWRKEGLKPIEPNSSPYLFLGSDIRIFLSNQMKSQRVSLSTGEFYCIRCKKAVKPLETSLIDRKIEIGKGKSSIFLGGICPICKLKLRRFSTLEQQTKTEAIIPVKEEIKTKGDQLLPLDKRCVLTLLGFILTRLNTHFNI